MEAPHHVLIHCMADLICEKGVSIRVIDLSVIGHKHRLIYRNPHTKERGAKNLSLHRLSSIVGLADSYSFAQHTQQKCGPRVV